MDYLVLYESKTGNTERVAQAIFNQLPGNAKRIKRIEEYEGNEDADIIFLGFWTDRGTCPMQIANAMETLEEKKIALFGTCGMGGDENYYKQIKHSVEAWLPDECEELGFFMCQGKMQEQVLKKYEQMKAQIPPEQYEKMVLNYHEALTHPDTEDLDNVTRFVQEIIGRSNE